MNSHKNQPQSKTSCQLHQPNNDLILNQQPNFFCRILSNLTICAFNLTVWGPSFDRQLCLSWNPLALFSSIWTFVVLNQFSNSNLLLSDISPCSDYGFLQINICTVFFFVKVCFDHEPNSGGPMGGSWDQIRPPRPFEDLRGPQKGLLGPKRALLGAVEVL